MYVGGVNLLYSVTFVPWLLRTDFTVICDICTKVQLTCHKQTLEGVIESVLTGQVSSYYRLILEEKSIGEMKVSTQGRCTVDVAR